MSDNTNNQIVDINDLYARYGKDCDNEFIDDIFEICIENIKSNIDNIVAANDQTELEFITRQVHSIKGVSSNMSAYAISNKAATLENELRNGITENLIDSIDDIQSEFENLINFISQENWLELNK